MARTSRGVLGIGGRVRVASGDRRGSVAVVAAVAMPVCVGVMALGIDVSNWAATRVRLQGLADVAAMAGASRYAQEFGGSTAGPDAVTVAANVAEMNGVPVGARAGTGTTTVTDNFGDWTTSFSINTATGMLTATVRTSTPVYFGQMFTGVAKQFIAATAVAQVAPRTSGGQSCVVALSGDATGITTNDDILLSGNTDIGSKTCGLRSDGDIQISGNAQTNVPYVVASGQMDVSGNGAINCPSKSSCQQAGAPQISDPFSSQYSGALGTPSVSGKGSVSGSTVNPGNFSSGLSLGGNGSYTLNPGVYNVTGNISFSGNVQITGNGVTLYSTGTIQFNDNSAITGNGVSMVSSGGIAFSGNTVAKLTAPSSGPTAGLLYGTSSSTASVNFSGNTFGVLNGAVYAPNANVSYSGNSNSNPSTCFEIVASTASFSGNTSFTNSNCSSLGVPNTWNLPPYAKLVQ